jgi:thiosulfate/3-mercaptopyruvate sulfurtransferase
MPDLPLLIEPANLEDSLAYENVLIVDLSKPHTYAKLHIPGAVHLDYAKIVTGKKPVMGLVPDDATLAAVFSSIGIGNDTHVIACDDEGGGRAARLLWTLAVAGHHKGSLLNGGLHAWVNEGHPHDNAPVTPDPAQFNVVRDDSPSATHDYILDHLDDAGCCLLDVRSANEFTGVKKYAERGGHIPGAVNLDWTEAMDKTRNLRFKPDNELTDLFASVGATADREIITYCQTHHRSAHTWVVLRHLGYERVKGFPGSWSYWGNHAELPVE